MLKKITPKIYAATPEGVLRRLLDDVLYKLGLLPNIKNLVRNYYFAISVTDDCDTSSGVKTKTINTNTAYNNFVKMWNSNKITFKFFETMCSEVLSGLKVATITITTPTKSYKFKIEKPTDLKEVLINVFKIEVKIKQITTWNKFYGYLYDAGIVKGQYTITLSLGNQSSSLTSMKKEK